MLMILQSIMVFIYIGYFKPFPSKLFNYLEVFNESSILVISYHLLTFTDWFPDPNL